MRTLRLIHTEGEYRGADDLLQLTVCPSIELLYRDPEIIELRMSLSWVTQNSAPPPDARSSDSVQAPVTTSLSTPKPARPILPEMPANQDYFHMWDKNVDIKVFNLYLYPLVYLHSNFPSSIGLDIVWAVKTYPFSDLDGGSSIDSSSIEEYNCFEDYLCTCLKTQSIFWALNISWTLLFIWISLTSVSVYYFYVSHFEMKGEIIYCRIILYRWIS